jgi:dTDP-4-dehydrorhamnose 3,5-epimerase
VALADISGVRVTDLVTRADDRGSFTETYRAEWLGGGTRPIVQSNLSRSRAGVLRGLHFHREQADYWCVVQGRAFVALVDLRPGSPSFRTVETSTFDAGAGLRALYVPPGIAHGFCALTEVSLIYQVDAYFTGRDEFGLAWDDPELAIGWPVTDPVLSERDRANPSLADVLRGRPT